MMSESQSVSKYLSLKNIGVFDILDEESLSEKIL